MIDDRPVALDLCCCQGGASAGYARAGYRVVGVDIDPQPRYPFEFVLGDAIALLPALVERYSPVLVVGSPPCQLYTKAWRIQKNDHPDLVAPMREAFIATGLPYVIENVEGAPLLDPLVLCGLMFGLKTDRHRLFESNVPLSAPPHPNCRALPKTKMGRAFVDGELRQYVGNFHGPAAAREDLGVPWMSRDGIRECIPPAYTEHLGQQLLAAVARRGAA